MLRGGRNSPHPRTAALMSREEGRETDSREEMRKSDEDGWRESELREGVVRDGVGGGARLVRQFVLV